MSENPDDLNMDPEAIRAIREVESMFNLQSTPSSVENQAEIQMDQGEVNTLTPRMIDAFIKTLSTSTHSIEVMAENLMETNRQIFPKGTRRFSLDNGDIYEFCLYPRDNDEDLDEKFILYKLSPKELTSPFEKIVMINTAKLNQTRRLSSFSYWGTDIPSQEGQRKPTVRTVLAFNKINEVLTDLRGDPVLRNPLRRS